LRFEVNFGLFPFFLGLYEVGVGPVEGAVGGCLVADEEAEVLGDGDTGGAPKGISTFARERVALEAESAEAEPLVLGHPFDEDLLGRGGGLEFLGKIGEEGFEFLGVFAWNEAGGGGGEAVRKMIKAGLGLARS
jgi:hypothetical protein